MTPQQAADLLEAFQYNLLPMLGQPGAELAIEDGVRANWFSALGSGTTWTIVDTEAPPGSPPLPPQDPDVVAKELAQEATWLPALNAAQAAFSADARALVTARRRLLELYWKSQMAPLIQDELGTLPWGISSMDQLTSAVAAEAQTVNGLMQAMANTLAQGEIPAPLPGQTLQDAIAAFAKEKRLPSWRTLKAVAQPAFFEPVDPVMVVSGTQSGMTIDAGAKLACRWPSQAVTALDVSTGAGPTLTVSSAELAPHLPEAAWMNLPSVVSTLYRELFLLDPANAAMAAAVAGQTLSTDQLQAAAASVAKPAPAANAGTAAALSPTWPWTQPWRPVYLDWDVEWLPIPFQQANGMPNWTFDGLDYETVASPVAAPATGLLGRALVTPKPSFEFKSRIEQFTADNPASPATRQLGEIDQVIAKVDG